MPRFRITRAIAGREVSAIRALCDGCDPARPCDEHAESAKLWLLTAGAFEIRDARGRRVIDPSRAVALPRHHMFQIRHPAGPDTCLVFRGPIIDALAARGPRFLPIAPGQLAGILAGVADDDELALAEAICQLADDPEDPGAEDPGAADPGARPAAAAGDRDLTAAIAEALRAGYAEPTSLGELAATAGYSVFHACRVFRATTGATIHGFRRELRLRHALARILAGDEPLTEVALATGFASQSHLTNRFRARFGVTPARARTRDGRRRLLAHSMSIDLNVP